MKYKVGEWYKKGESIFLLTRRIGCRSPINGLYICRECKGKIEGLGLDKPWCPYDGSGFPIFTLVKKERK
jgi:hypothetical protein